MSGFLKFLVGLLLFAALLFGIYQILPEFSHNIIHSVFQNQFDKEAKAKIEETKALMNPKLEADYKTILETHTDTKGWVYSPVTKAVTFYGNKAQLDLKEIEGGEGRYYDNTVVKVEFKPNDDNGVDIEVYVNNSSTPEDDKVRAVIFEQLLKGLDSMR